MNELLFIADKLMDQNITRVVGHCFDNTKTSGTKTRINKFVNVGDFIGIF